MDSSEAHRTDGHLQVAAVSQIRKEFVRLCRRFDIGVTSLAELEATLVSALSKCTQIAFSKTAEAMRGMQEIEVPSLHGA